MGIELIQLIVLITTLIALVWDAHCFPTNLLYIGIHVIVLTQIDNIISMLF